MSTRYFEYGDTETDYLKAKDKRLGEVIDAIGHVERVVDEDLFSSVVHHIIGQQISTKAQATIWGKMLTALGTVNADTISAATESELQSLGMTFRKVAYIKDFADKVCASKRRGKAELLLSRAQPDLREAKVKSGEFDIDGIERLSDEDAIKTLSSLKGIGVWTAEMILLFCLQRPNIFSYDDLAIQRGLRMVYHHRKISRELFEKYRRRFSPYCSVASLYLWAVAGGAIPGMKDYAVKK